MSKKASNPQPPNCQRPAPPPAPPKPRNPKKWGFGGEPGWPGGFDMPPGALDEPPEPTSQEIAEMFAHALKNTDAALLIQASDIIEKNAENLQRLATTLDGQWIFPPAQARYDNDMAVVKKLRLLAKRKPTLDIYDQLVSAHQHLLASSDAYDKGCMDIKNILDSWPQEDCKK